MNRELTRFECFNHYQICTVAEIVSLPLPVIVANVENECVLLSSENTFEFGVLLRLVSACDALFLLIEAFAD